MRVMHTSEGPFVHRASHKTTANELPRHRRRRRRHTISFCVLNVLYLGQGHTSSAYTQIGSDVYSVALTVM